MLTETYIKNEQRYCAPTYAPLPVVLHKGQGVWLWDVEGDKYLDFLSGYSAISLGHAHPRILKVMEEQAATLSLTSRAFYNDQLAPLLEQLCQLSGLEMGVPMNTGAEAVETAIKAARRWGYLEKKIPENQAEIIVASNNFHGRTTTIISFSTEELHRKGFAPFTPGFVIIPFGDSQALEKAINPNVCAFLVEPIQGEGGIIVPKDGWLQEAQEICRRNNVLFILDEVQSGLGRTGRMFAYQHEKGVKPDGLILGKALGGGVLPISVFLSKREVLSLLTPGTHGSTFGGNPLACRIGRETLKIIEEDGLVENSAKLGQYLIERLKEKSSPLLKEIRGKGLWIGLEFDPSKVSGQHFCHRLLKRGILTKETQGTVVRLAPPLVISQEELDYGIEGIIATLEEFERDIE